MMRAPASDPHDESDEHDSQKNETSWLHRKLFHNATVSGKM
jgi:hypothetical protein